MQDAGQVNVRVQNDLNKFLTQWLTHLIMPGHGTQMRFRLDFDLCIKTTESFISTERFSEYTSL